MWWNSNRVRLSRCNSRRLIKKKKKNLDNTEVVLGQSREDKLNKLLDCIDNIVIKDDAVYITYNKNVVEIYADNKVSITKGLDINLATQIHLNPTIDKTLIDIKDIISQTKQSTISAKGRSLLFGGKGKKVC